MITISKIDLIEIVTAAGVWYAKMNEILHAFDKELERTKQLYDELYKEEWKPNEELMIEKLPF